MNFAGGFAAHFVATKWAFGLQNGTHVPRGGFAGGVLWLQKFFAGKASFRRVTLLAAKFSQEHKFLCFCASLVPCGFPPLILKFLIIFIIQKV